MQSVKPAIEIRHFNDGDLFRLERHMPSLHHPRRAAAHARGTASFLLAWQGDEPAGYLLIKWAGADEEIVHRLIGDCPELNAITVTQELRSCGIGTTLIHTAEHRISERGFSRVGLTVGVTNERARSLYERIGYRGWDHGSFEVTWDAPDGPGGQGRETCIYLLKPLDARTALLQSP